MKESVRKTLMFLMAVGFLTGFALLLYPMFSNMWNEYNSKLKFEEYQHENAEKAEDTSLEEEWEKAAAYNERLQPIVIPDSFIQAEQEEVTQQDSEYMSCLNQNGDGMMGYLSIPKIGEIIPVYHTSREEVLQKGAGHIQGSSLPIGGTSTHASIAAHRGIPGMSLFTDRDAGRYRDFKCRRGEGLCNSGYLYAIWCKYTALIGAWTQSALCRGTGKGAGKTGKEEHSYELSGMDFYWNNSYYRFHCTMQKHHPADKEKKQPRNKREKVQEENSL